MAVTQDRHGVDYAFDQGFTSS